MNQREFLNLFPLMDSNHWPPPSRWCSKPTELKGKGWGLPSSHYSRQAKAPLTLMGALGDCQSRFDIIREDIMHPIEIRQVSPFLGGKGFGVWRACRSIRFGLFYPTLMGAQGEIQSQSMLLMLLRGYYAPYRKCGRGKQGALGHLENRLSGRCHYPFPK